MTERGYPRDPATGGLRLDDPEVEAGPLTVVSCDNLPRNGEVLARLVRDFCARLPGHAGAPLLAWMKQHAAFPSTMSTASSRPPRRPTARRWRGGSGSPSTAPNSGGAGSTRASPTGWSRSAPTGCRSCPRASPRPPGSGSRRARPRWIALALAAWARHLQGDGLAVNDPGAEPIQRALGRARDHDGEAAAVLTTMGSELTAPGPLRDLVADWLGRIDVDGIGGALRETT